MNIRSYTNVEKYKQIGNAIKTDAVKFALNGTNVSVNNMKIADSISTVKSVKDISISDYSPPSTMAIETFAKLGDQIDKSIESSFLLQAFNMKGTDIICSTFCFMLSLMPCSARNALYETISGINTAAKIAQTTARAVNNLVDTANLFGSTKDAITSSVGTIFNKPSLVKSINTQEIMSTVSSVIAVPQSIKQNVELISNAIKLGLNFKFAMPDFLGKGVWDLAQNVLFVLQGMALQVADEAMNKVLGPVEDMINSIQPSICFNNMADRIRVNILQVLNSHKSRILSEIADIFASNEAFNSKFRQVNNKLGWCLELNSLTQAFNLISSNLFAVAQGCGVYPCEESSDNEYPLISNVGGIEITDKTNPFGSVISDPSTPPIYIYPSKDISVIDKEKNIDNINPTKEFKNIDEIADKFKDFMFPADIEITEDSIKSTYNILNNAPEQIQEFVKSGLLDNILDSNYTINLNNALVTYNYVRKCS